MHTHGSTLDANPGTTQKALPTKEGVYIGVVLFRPDSPLIAAIKSKEDAKAFFGEYFPQFVELLREEDLEVGAVCLYCVCYISCVSRK